MSEPDQLSKLTDKVFDFLGMLARWSLMICGGAAVLFGAIQVPESAIHQILQAQYVLGGLSLFGIAGVWGAASKR
ncbi:MAG: hypothetical protein AB7F91_14500 [Parvularculaceae bacterium]